MERAGHDAEKRHEAMLEAAGERRLLVVVVVAEFWYQPAALSVSGRFNFIASTNLLGRFKLRLAALSLARK